MLNQPTSSPMIIMMLGFVCAAAGAIDNARVANNMSVTTPAILSIHIVNLLRQRPLLGVRCQSCALVSDISPLLGPPSMRLWS